LAFLALVRAHGPAFLAMFRSHRRSFFASGSYMGVKASTSGGARRSLVM